MIDLQCPRCDAQFEVSDEIAGREAKCPSCEAEFLLPLGLGAGLPELVGEPVQPAAFPPADPPRTGGGSLLLAMFFAAAAGAGLWWLQQAALSPTDEGFQPADSVWAKFIGRFHPLIVHLPIGILSAAGLLEFLRLFSRRPDRLAPAMTVVLWAAAVSCLAAISVGYLLVLDGGTGSNDRLLEQHIQFGRWFGAAVLTALFLWHVCRWIDIWLFRSVFRLSLLAAFALMGAGSHYGGAMVHGPTHLTRHMPEALQPFAIKLGLIDAPKEPVTDETEVTPPEVPNGEEVDPTEPIEPDPIETIEPDPTETIEPDPANIIGPVNGGPVVEPVDATTVMVYRDLVDPVFEMKCMECHEEGNAKGKLRMDTYADLMKGGSLGKSIVAGNAGDSELVFRLLLPLDDDERMPPSKKEQLTEAELALLQWWIDQGAAQDLAVPLDKLPESFRSLVAESEPTGLSSLR